MLPRLFSPHREALAPIKSDNKSQRHRKQSCLVETLSGFLVLELELFPEHAKGWGQVKAGQGVRSGLSAVLLMYFS